ncbi:App1 family protein [Ahrensia sp. R2A130]|uniref:App1 family protein n=1 Tax=Ahrensia sp. R2A130 TaxID=744979 RepID=UPI0001E0844C|nr:phosphatase domain-containing protein [Ahrensia sp. R2A130]EFL88103.1 conserved hypothetical protein [Ahrensia sp. R2A130]
MTSQKASTIQSAVLLAERSWDRIKRRASDRLGFNGTAIIQPYRGIGDSKRFWIRGRVLEDPGIVTAIQSDSLWTNLRHTFRRYETDEIPGATVQWSFGSQTGEVVTDDEGFFDFTIHPGNDFDPGADWQNVQLKLLEAPNFELHPLGAAVQVRTPSPQARYGIISDIDDTIVYTGATNFVKHWRTVVANSAESRQVYDHLPEFYDALTDGAAGAMTNPIYFVSSSPWNLFDLFERFMILNGIPLGPMLLKDFGLEQGKWLTGGHDGHKTKMIERVFDANPDLKFVLVGDSGQRDAEIYSGIAEKHTDRIRAIVIHDVTPDDRDATIKDALEKVEKLGIPVVYTDSYRTAHDTFMEEGLLPEARPRKIANIDHKAS